MAHYNERALLDRQPATLLTQRGHDIGSTDIPFMPALQA
jgi:hypothetical protein